MSSPTFLEANPTKVYTCLIVFAIFHKRHPTFIKYKKIVRKKLYNYNKFDAAIKNCSKNSIQICPYFSSLIPVDSYYEYCYYLIYNFWVDLVKPLIYPNYSFPKRPIQVFPVPSMLLSNLISIRTRFSSIKKIFVKYIDITERALRI